MIVEAEITGQPTSGDFPERIYDNENVWNSQCWSFIKFKNEDYTEWYGQFRGLPVCVAVSEAHNVVLVLTSDYLFQLNRDTGDVEEIEDQPQYRDLTLTPEGDFIIVDDRNLKKITNSISHKSSIKSEIEMDIIRLKEWNGSVLIFSCDEFLNWDRHFTMAYDSLTDEIKVQN